MEIHQIAACLVPGDAVSNYARFLQKLLRSSGFVSEIFADVVAPEYEQVGYPIEDYLKVDSLENVLLAHYSIASSGLLGLLHFQAAKILFYHNVTPYHYWLNTNSLAAYHCLQGKADLVRIVPHVQYGVAFSEFSLDDLRKEGLTKTDVVPLSLDEAQMRIPADQLTIAGYANKKNKVLMVGRVVPNKKIEEAIRIAALLPDVHLIIAGSWENSVHYYYALRTLAHQLKVKCEFLGAITQAQLNALYQTSDLLLVLSEHEGFCMPILEAFFHKLPVLAYAAGAIPETAKDGALLFHKMDLDHVAGLISLVLRDPAIRAQLQKQGGRVLKEHQQFPVKEKLFQIIEEVASSKVR